MYERTGKDKGMKLSENWISAPGNEFSTGSLTAEKKGFWSRSSGNNDCSVFLLDKKRKI